MWGALLPFPLSAQESGYDQKVVTCESKDMAWVHCDMDVSQGVDLVRQLSSNSCVRGSEWGTDRSGVWVTLGCRADFRARSAGPGATSATGAPTVRRVVRCESSGRPQSCPVRLDGGAVRLLRQLSVLPCREGQGWGYRRNEVWTSRGCQGDFEVSDKDGRFVDVPRRLTCESKSKKRRFCGVSIGAGAVVSRQLSSTACVQGQTWGWDRHGIWVDGGCRAEFSVN
ncbi:DUF3011 domain-containing protein [Stenotrophomonas sp. 24(2023)]|uniref:DUF3011 domain-containing protein n=1 Tax=Stenotrophomonas sp. 24(2023) TaxID=3068324 RepID=UPI0027E00C1D|nr:DUF3011 domain-containing protein [Stenotrophomonas sp. 24(2023)]WMJ71538.1 DUF3011 domain-containing protein [Stenotrophomonas sp. 24(2023)]